MSTEIDQQFVEYVVKSLVGNPDAVKVGRSVDEKGVLLELTVDPEDLGRVIGKRGATAQSMRTLLRALGTKNDARYNLKIVDNGEPRPAPSTSTSASASDSSDQANDDNTSDDNASDTSSDDTSRDEQVENVEADVSEEAEAASEPGETPEEEDSDDLAAKTRKELAELDDLDL